MARNRNAAFSDATDRGRLKPWKSVALIFFRIESTSSSVQILSGEEVSVSLGYALRTTDRLTPPIRASKNGSTTLNEVDSRDEKSGMKPKKEFQAEKG